MTENEAIDWTKKLKLSEEIREFYYAESFIKACDIAIQALEKQIQKKPETRNATCDDIESELRDFITTQGKICRCPTCKNTICVRGLEYCWCCGQRLDWTEESEGKQ